MAGDNYRCIGSGGIKQWHQTISGDLILPASIDQPPSEIVSLMNTLSRSKIKPLIIAIGSEKEFKLLNLPLAQVRELFNGNLAMNGFNDPSLLESLRNIKNQLYYYLHHTQIPIIYVIGLQSEMSLAEEYKLDLVANFRHLELLSAVLDRTLENVEARDMAQLSIIILGAIPCGTLKEIKEAEGFAQHIHHALGCAESFNRYWKYSMFFQTQICLLETAERCEFTSHPLIYDSNRVKDFSEECYFFTAMILMTVINDALKHSRPISREWRAQILGKTGGFRREQFHPYQVRLLFKSSNILPYPRSLEPDPDQNCHPASRHHGVPPTPVKGSSHRDGNSPHAGPPMEIRWVKSSEDSLNMAVSKVPKWRPGSVPNDFSRPGSNNRDTPHRGKANKRSWHAT